MNRIRLSLNLLHYFQDHRQLAKIFIKKDMKLIQDVHDHIINIFEINKNFYLMSQNHYLPSTEDINILNDNDTVYVIPNIHQQQNTHEQEDIIVKKKKSKKIKNIETTNENVEIPEKIKKKKSKKKHAIIETDNIETPENGEEIPKENEILHNIESMDMDTNEIDNNEKNSKKNKKSKRSINFAELNHDTNSEQNKTCNSVTHENGVLETNDINNDCEIYELNNESNCNITKNTTRIVDETHDDSIADDSTEITNNSSNDYIQESRRKRRRCISPAALICTSVNDETQNRNNVTTASKNNNIVKTIQNLTLEKQDALMQSLQHSPRKSYSINDVLHFNKSSPAANEVNTILEKTSNLTSIKPLRKQYSGVGKVLQLLKSEHESDDTSDNNTSMTTRKRTRTRRRKHKKTELTNDEENTTNYVFVPPKTKAAPKCHIKFTEDSDKFSNIKVENNNKESLGNFDSTNNFVHSTPLNRSLRSQKNIITIDNLNIDTLPKLSDKPALNSIIIFKKLKLDSNYSPVISNYILAEVRNVSLKGDELILKILEGHNELEEPSGRFSCNNEEEEDEMKDIKNDELIQTIEFSTLIEARLVNLP